MADLPRRPLAPSHQYRNFLSAAEHSALLEWAIDNAGRFRPARLTGNVLDPGRRIAERLNDLGPHRPEVAAHGDGAFFAHHSDMRNGKDRKPLGGDETGTQDRLVSAVYYFHREPKRFSGGTLRLYRLGDHDASGDYLEFQPEQNSLVVFPSWVRHEVRPVACPGCGFEDYRFAVNAWLCKTLAPRPAGAEVET